MRSGRLRRLYGDKNKKRLSVHEHPPQFPAHNSHVLKCGTPATTAGRAARGTASAGNLPGPALVYAEPASPWIICRVSAVQRLRRQAFIPPRDERARQNQFECLVHALLLGDDTASDPCRR